MTDRLLLVVAAFFPDSYGGAERQAQILADALGRRGVDVTLVAPTVAPDVPEVEETAFGRIVRRKVRHYPNLGGRRIASFLAWTAWFAARFGGAAWRGVPVYVFHARLHAAGPALAAMRSGSPLLVKLGGGGEASEFAALRAKRFFYGDWVEALLRRRVDRFVANSGQIADELLALGIPDRRIARFPNGVVLPPAERLEAALAGRSGRRFVYAGRLVADKRIAVLHEAALAVEQGGDAVELRLVGEGPERDRLAPTLAKDGSAAVRYPGYTADVYGELLGADFFVSASMREGQSNALLEAMSAGVVPIVYAASGVAEIVTQGETGFVVPESTPEAFAAAMRAALRLDPDRRAAMARAARGFAEAHIGIDSVAERTLATIADIQRERSGP
ncbi:glycosyltransferase family 4 protein [Prosthecomicrobium sp. N25]|uniref:glycosyltransferase family 4 protein n=1 Tax=Prosthecomicrobium sp. N25 TaxID=3129254 RepID=UPI0030768F04